MCWRAREKARMSMSRGIERLWSAASAQDCMETTDQHHRQY
jgi:hypothetical protein